MNAKAFLGAALTSALELGIGTPDDVIVHVTPDVLAAHLPRPLWARLLVACLGAPRVDARVIVEAVGIANLCEHVPATILWTIVSDLGVRALGGQIATAPMDRISSPAIVAPPPKPLVATPPPPKPVAVTPPSPVLPPVRTSSPALTPPLGVPPHEVPTSRASAPVLTTPPAMEEDEKPTYVPSRARTPTSQRFRQSQTGIGRLAGTTAAPPAAAPAPDRRPQATATAPEPAAPRAHTDSGAFDVETEVGRDDWKSALAVDDDLVDWSSDDPAGPALTVLTAAVRAMTRNHTPIRVGVSRVFPRCAIR